MLIKKCILFVMICIVLLLGIFFGSKKLVSNYQVTTLEMIDGSLYEKFVLLTDKESKVFVDKLIKKYSSTNYRYSDRNFSVANRNAAINIQLKDKAYSVSLIGDAISIVEYQNGILLDEYVSVCEKKDISRINEIFEIGYTEMGNEKSYLSAYSDNFALFDTNGDSILKSKSSSSDKEKIQRYKSFKENVIKNAFYQAESVKKNF